MIKLMVESREVQNASLPIRWCVEKAAFEALRQRGIKNPHLLLVIKPQRGGREFRHLVPLEQMVQYVSFSKPGENMVFATIVWNLDGEVGKLREYYLKRSGGSYDTDAIGSDGQLYELRNSLGSANLTIEVPEEAFAKEPPEWEKKWVNYCFEEEPIDQCHYRKRKWLFAYPIQPFLMLIFVTCMLGVVMPIRLIAAIFFLVIGRWDIDFKPLIHLFSRGTEDIWYYTDPDENFYGRRVDKLVEAVLKGLTGKSIAEIRKEMAAAKEARKKAAEAKLWESLQYLSCENTAASPYQVLPAQYKIYLRFHDLKAKVCRPFAR
ncbi:MAG: hypothetical protein Q8R12_04170 [bacterium]|nr:hypothetical protein [bacterium]